MPDSKITDLTTGTTVVPADWLVYVDVSDTTMAATGTDKKLSPSVLVAGLPAFVASGTNHAPGIVPDPGSVAGTTKFLREDATFAVPAGGVGFGPSGPSHAIGLVPDPGSVAGTTKYLREDATWFTPPTGSGGSPGGTAGQLQWNSAGSFGGVTVSGDGTLNTSTGVLTITKTNSVALAASATTDTTNAANITSGTLPVARVPVFVASGASHAVGLVPDPGASAGTTKFLREDATFAVPAGGTGGNSNLVYSGRSGTAVTNTVTPSSLLSAITNDVGTLTLSAGALNSVGRILRIVAYGTWSGTATGALSSIVLSLGGVTIAQGTTSTLAAVTGKIWMIDFGYFSTRTLGASGTLQGCLHFYMANATGSGGIGVMFMTATGLGNAPSPATLDLTSALAIDFKVTWNEANASDSIQAQHFAVYIDG